MIFTVFVIVYQKSSDASVHIHILLLFSFLIFPLFDGIISNFLREKKIFDGRSFFVGALLIFCFVAFYLIFWENQRAESLSIYAYYLLIAWVVWQVWENIISSKKNKNV
jgi:hypothetical protein